MNINQLVFEELNILQERLWHPDNNGNYIRVPRGSKDHKKISAKNVQLNNITSPQLGRMYKNPYVDLKKELRLKYGMYKEDEDYPQENRFGKLKRKMTHVGKKIVHTNRLINNVLGITRRDRIAAGLPEEEEEEN